VQAPGIAFFGKSPNFVRLQKRPDNSSHLQKSPDITGSLRIVGNPIQIETETQTNIERMPKYGGGGGVDSCGVVPTRSGDTHCSFHIIQ